MRLLSCFAILVRGVCRRFAPLGTEVSLTSRQTSRRYLAPWARGQVTHFLFFQGFDRTVLYTSGSQINSSSGSGVPYDGDAGVKKRDCASSTMLPRPENSLTERQNVTDERYMS